MFDSRGRLDIFESFVVDTNLPKHRPPPAPTGTTTIIYNSPMFSVVSGSGNIRVDSGSKPSLWRRFVEWFREYRRMPIEAFFKSVKNGVEELEVVENRMKGYLAAIDQAKKNGQTALAEQLGANVEGVRTETQLVALKLRKYITEEQLVSFVKKAKKGLRLDWIRNFTRVIPEGVVKVKNAADERSVFDNYVVLHYDPQAKAYSETEAEREKRKDPILFGVLRGRRRLYFVGDWTDEFCDLTLDQLADVLGETPKLIPQSYEYGGSDDTESWKGKSR